MSTKAPLDLAQFDGHTAGPWEIEQPSKECSGHIIHGGSDYAEVAVTYTGVIDAALIQHAPELLAELRERRAKDAMVIEALSMANHFFRNTMGWDSRDAMVERVSVALAAVKDEPK